MQTRSRRRNNLKRKREASDTEAFDCCSESKTTENDSYDTEPTNRKKRKLNQTKKANPKTKEVVEDEYLPTKEEQKDITDDEDYAPTKKRKKRKKNGTTKPKAKAAAKPKGKGKGKGKGRSKKSAMSTEDRLKAMEKEITRMKSMHKQFLAEGYKYVIGVDEAGRGPLAGPVVVGACYCPLHVRIPGIADSKQITEEMREDLFEIIVHHPQIEYAVVVLDHHVIDDLNILGATLKGMRDSSAALNQKLIAKLAKRDKTKTKTTGNEKETDETKPADVVDMILVDGNRDPCFVDPPNVDSRTVIKGDGNVYCIAAASIVAKVTRDRMMFEYDKLYPIYDFAVHKGYPTPYHKQTVTEHGPCPIHRLSFRPVIDWVKIHRPEVWQKIQDNKQRQADARKLAYKLKKQKEKEMKQLQNPKRPKAKKASKAKSKPKAKAKSKSKKTKKTKSKAKHSEPDGESFLVSEEEDGDDSCKTKPQRSLLSYSFTKKDTKK